MDNATRIGTFHKPNKTGRAWYVVVNGEQPVTNEPVRVIRKDGMTAHVQVFDCVPRGAGQWLCRFHHVSLEGGGSEAYQAATKPSVIDGASLLGDAASEANAEAQAAVNVDIEGALKLAREALAQDGKNLGLALSARVAEAVHKALSSVTGRVEYVNAQGVAIDCGRQHKTFPKLLKLVSEGFNVWLPGPAGSGKTSAAAQVAKAMGLKFYHQGKALMEHQLLGYQDAQGRYVSTIFRVAFETGGLFLADECDGSEAKALLPLNMALEQGEMAFPDGIIKRHADFHMVAAANTFGQGGDSDYVGRNRLDGAFLDRFIPLKWDYDNEFESYLSGNPQWTERVQALRAKAKAKGIKVLITPRASILGARMLATGWEQSEVETLCIRKSMTDEQWNTISRDY